MSIEQQGRNNQLIRACQRLFERLGRVRHGRAGEASGTRRKSDYLPDPVYVGLGAHAYKRRAGDGFIAEEIYKDLPD